MKRLRSTREILHSLSSLRVHWGADVVATGLLLDGGGHDGRMRNASLMEAVWRWSHHVRGETAGHQAGRRKRRQNINSGVKQWTSVNVTRKANLAHKLLALDCKWNSLCLLPLSRLNSYTQWVTCLLFVQIKTFSKGPLFTNGWRKVECVVTMVTAWPWHLKPLSVPRSKPWRAFWQPSTQNTFTKCLSQFPIVNTKGHCNGQRGKLGSILLHHTHSS